MKYECYKIEIDKYGYEFIKNNVMKTNENKPCMQCGEATCFIEVCSEGYFCSDECESKWYENIK